MNLKILVPSGIGDFSWTWSKLVMTPHNFHIQYIGGVPDRMRAFLALLPKERILSYGPNNNYATKWNDQDELVCFSRNPNQFPEIQKAYKLSDLNEHEYKFLESNTFLEAGNRLEGWLGSEVPATDFHYHLEGALPKVTKNNYFVVNYSSYATKKAWGYYSVQDSAEVISFLSEKMKCTPLFIGGDYDDYTRDIHEHLVRLGKTSISLVGKTPDLRTIVALLQQSRAYIGACSGLMVLTNALHVPVATYYPGFDHPPGRKLAGMWHDPQVPYLSLFWTSAEKNIQEIDDWLCQKSVIS